MDHTAISVLQERLITAISAYVQDETIWQAFRAVPRDAFVTTFYDRCVPNKREWRLVLPDEPDWLEKVYTDRPLTTSLDAEGYPVSSSSQPHLMALMLQSAHLHPGSRVLEIGTGTGYNAALLAHLVGPEQVVTVDINAALLDAARERIARTGGPGVTVLHQDGCLLPKELGLFDALIVTGAHTEIAPSWISALAPGGRLVFNWSRSLTKVMLELEKKGSTLAGRVCDYGGDFMPLHDGEGARREQIPYERLDVITHCAFQKQFVADLDFAFFLQINLPSLVYHSYKNPKGDRVYVVKEAKSERVIQLFTQVICGDASLWKEIEGIAETFERLNRPSRSAFPVCVDALGMMTFGSEPYGFVNL